LVPIVAGLLIYAPPNSLKGKLHQLKGGMAREDVIRLLGPEFGYKPTDDEDGLEALVWKESYVTAIVVFDHGRVWVWWDDDESPAWLIKARQVIAKVFGIKSP